MSPLFLSHFPGGNHKPPYIGIHHIHIALWEQYKASLRLSIRLPILVSTKLQYVILDVLPDHMDMKDVV